MTSIPEDPTYQDILNNLEAWENYLTNLNHLIVKAKHEKYQKELDQELQQYVNEKDYQRRNRARQRSEWVQEDVPHINLSENDLKCINVDVCWYQDNISRLNKLEYHYRLKGTSHVILCDSCFDDLEYSLSKYCVKTAIGEDDESNDESKIKQEYNSDVEIQPRSEWDRN